LQICDSELIGVNKKMNTLEQIKTIITDNIARENQGIMYHNVILEVLKKYNGKKPTKRIANDLQVKLPNDRVFFKPETFGQNYIEIWINGKYENRQSHFLGYNNRTRFGDGNIVDFEQFDNEYDSAYGKYAIKRNENRQALLNNPVKLQQIADSIDNLNSAINQYNDVLKYGDNEDYFRIEKLVIKKLEDHKKEY
jgi:hypothetical protein